MPPLLLCGHLQQEMQWPLPEGQGAGPPGNTAPAPLGQARAFPLATRAQVEMKLCKGPGRRALRHLQGPGQPQGAQGREGMRGARAQGALLGGHPAGTEVATLQLHLLLTASKI